MMRTRSESPEVLYTDEPIVAVDAADVARLKCAAEENPRQRIRLCAHRGAEDRLHEMLIVHTMDAYVRPHKHLGKTESFHIIEGHVDVVIFDDLGAVDEVIRMGPFESGRPFFYRIADPLFHTLLIRSPMLVFHETTSGPFMRAQTVFAPWAPGDADRDAVELFLARLNGTVATCLSARP